MQVNQPQTTGQIPSMMNAQNNQSVKPQEDATANTPQSVSEDANQEIQLDDKNSFTEIAERKAELQEKRIEMQEQALANAKELREITSSEPQDKPSLKDSIKEFFGNLKDAIIGFFKPENAKNKDGVDNKNDQLNSLDGRYEEIKDELKQVQKNVDLPTSD